METRVTGGVGVGRRHFNKGNEDDIIFWKRLFMGEIKRLRWILIWGRKKVTPTISKS